MLDLAPHIYRQRLLIEGAYSRPVDEASIRAFLLGITAHLGLTTYTTPTVHCSDGIGNPKNQGFEAFLPLIESGIAIYTWNSSRFVSLIVYTCKPFDAQLAIDYTTDFFGVTDVATMEF